MNQEQLIPVEAFCTHHEVEFTFIHELQERGLVQMTVIQGTYYIDPVQLPDLERMARLHHDLEINLEGIEALSHMLERVERLHEEVRALRNRLERYEEP